MPHPTFTYRMQYIPGLSHNAYKLPNGATKPHVRRWMRELSALVGASDIPSAPQYVVGIRGRFADERRPDISNLFKVILDAVELGLKVNDKYFTAVDNGYETGYLSPEIIITVTPKGSTNE